MFKVPGYTVVVNDENNKIKFSKSEYKIHVIALKRSTPKGGKIIYFLYNNTCADLEGMGCPLELIQS